MKPGFRASRGAFLSPRTNTGLKPAVLRKNNDKGHQGLPPARLTRQNHESETCRSFLGRNGTTEHFVMVSASAGGSFADQLASLQDRYAAALTARKLAPETAIFRRIFLSDILNQADTLSESALIKETAGNPVATSVIQQVPLCGAKIALFAYHIDSRTPIEKEFIGPRHMLMKSNGIRHLWSAGASMEAKPALRSPANETRAVFNELVQVLDGQGATLDGHCIRTWLFIKDIDMFYLDLVDSRRELFERHGLTRDTHYIASTGIEGSSAGRFDTVTLDALSLPDLQPQQVFYLNDFSRLCATKDYDVTFERGTRIAFADRRHYYISGTASIDSSGNVLHVGDVLGQTERAIGNVGALLRSGGASLDDLMYLIAYLRDPADYYCVERYLRSAFPRVPHLIVQGRVCRPEWLAEFEGVAVTPYHDPSLPPF